MVINAFGYTYWSQINARKKLIETIAHSHLHVNNTGCKKGNNFPSWVLQEKCGDEQCVTCKITEGRAGMSNSALSLEDRSFTRPLHTHGYLFDRLTRSDYGHCGCPQSINSVGGMSDLWWVSTISDKSIVWSGLSSFTAYEVFHSCLKTCFQTCVQPTWITV